MTTRVSLIAPEFLPNWGGVGTYCIELGRALSASSDVELDIVTLERSVDGHPAMSVEEMEQYFSERVRIHVVSKTTETFLYNAAFQLAVNRLLRKLERRGETDLIHSHHAHMSHILYGLKKRHLPIITTIHTTIDGQWQSIRGSGLQFGQLEPSERWQLLLHRGLRLAERAALRSGSRLITMSHWMMAELLKRWPTMETRIDLIPNGVNITRFSPDRASQDMFLGDLDGPVIMVSSRLTAAKGIHYAIDAMKLVLARRDDARFVFAGASQADYWQRYLASKGVPPSCFRFLGYVPYDALPAIYARATVYVLPTLYENIPLRMLEAMSSGTPVVTSNVGGISEVIRHLENGILVPPRDPEAIASSILMLLEDEGMARSLGRAARQTVVRNHDWNVIAEKVVHSYRLALEGGSV